MLCAATDDLEKKQIRKLKTRLSELIDSTDKITARCIIRMLESPPDPEEPDKLDATFECILSRLESFLEEYGMQHQSWGDFFDKSKPVTIIRMGNMLNSKDNPLADMLVASLYNYQITNHRIPMAIILDEIQDQNFSPTSPNYQMLAKSRKIGVSLIGATLHYRTKGVAYGEAMSFADTHIFLKPTPSAIRQVAEVLGLDSKEGYERLKKMRVGDCYVSSNMYSKVEGINVPAIISGRVPQEEELPATDGHQYYGNTCS